MMEIEKHTFPRSAVHSGLEVPAIPRNFSFLPALKSKETPPARGDCPVGIPFSAGHFF
jgi:hypothetical protein